MKVFILFFSVLLLHLSSFSQTAAHPAKDGWHLLDPEKDGYRGISLNQAYELLKGRKSNRVIVAVIDSGIDTAQEDLRPVLWRNEKEIPGNGKDDDGNGYTDDIYGWNFCGAPDGTNLARNSHEITRVYHGWKDQFEGKSEKDIPASQQFLYSQWKRSAALINKDYESASKELPEIRTLDSLLQQSNKILTGKLDTSLFSLKDIEYLQKNSNREISWAASLWIRFLTANKGAFENNDAVLKGIAAYRNDLENKVNRKEKKPEDWRGELVKDRYTDINDRYYGNNNLKSGSGDHGTLVAGIIGAVRGNGVGIDGIADNVRIMAVRAVPGGDEHDKDVALAIRYAVDNGAQIINMSFGKPASPYKQLVDDAIKYADSKGVLLIHACGNDGLDISEEEFYPNPFYLDGKRATNFLSVGASGDESTGAIAAPFSNYSATKVDVFAPGMHIYATATDNRYLSADGTSVAAPVATGVAALLKSYFPELTPAQLIALLTRSGVSVNKEVTQPGTEKKEVAFSRLSSSGHIINAYEAVKMALASKEGKKSF